MIEFINLEKVLPSIPKRVRDEESIPQLLSFALEGYRNLDLPFNKQQKVLLCEVNNHQIQLPDEVKSITLVTHQYCDPTNEETEELTKCFEESIYSSGDYLMSHKLYLHENFIGTDYHKNNFQPLKYIQGDINMCDRCINLNCHCNDTFSVNHTKVLTTSIKEGWLCILYETDINSNGEYFIINTADVKRYLSLYVQQQHLENRMYGAEAGILQIKDRIDPQVNIYYNKARGGVLLRGVNRRLISEITVDSTNNRFYKVLPDNWFKRSKNE